MLRSLVRFLVVCAITVVAAVPLTAAAAGGGGGGGSSNGMTITIGSPITLQGRLLVTVPVTVTCVAPISVDPTITQPGSIGVTLEQVSKNTVVVGSGGAELDSCSPTPQTFVIQVTPNVGQNASPPFHGGPAIVSAAGGICDFNFPQTCYNASTPWQTTKL
jgi:hypothetical protein